MSLDLYDKQKSCVILNDVSDHLPSLSIIHNCLPALEGTPQSVSRNLNDKNLDKYRDILTNVDWSEILDDCDVNENMKKFHNILIDKLNEVAPKKVHPVSTWKGLDERWMTKSLLRCAMKQLKLYSIALKSGKNDDLSRYKMYRNTFQKLKRYCKEKYFVERCYEFCSNGKNFGR